MCDSQTKECSKCKQTLPITSFAQRVNGGGPFAQCKTCFTRQKATMTVATIDGTKFDNLAKKCAKLAESYTAKNKQEANKRLLAIITLHFTIMNA
jgi:hypothetical protein